MLVTLLSLLAFFAFVKLPFFWHIWRSPRRNEIEMAVKDLIKLDTCTLGLSLFLRGTPRARSDQITLYTYRLCIITLVNCMHEFDTYTNDQVLCKEEKTEYESRFNLSV
ncbi:hypothetical protein DEU56DRAFT_240688 [Suillus clintonianus]|uniref:uncharacterized protein n=1 Tax=Suillus clintonianus TaxID=1904413 RepID=UPI001B867630|nr:uncharacterized protein DEU56DRAFT_240688 [Suillus clintonianus]KAG2110794.1 hypothetical protein DEU56DRAFT_240688 [Suillus clintonianus]